MDEEIVGKYFQSEKILNNLGDDPQFLNNIYFNELNFNPKTPIAILHENAIMTDLISNLNAGGNLHLVMSEKLKMIIENFRKRGLQFFKSSLIRKNIEYKNYYSLNMFEASMQVINFSKSIVSVRVRKKEGGTEQKILVIKSYDEFMNYVCIHEKKMEIVSINKISINSNIKKDFFMLRYVEGGVKYIVSDKLKKEVENMKCTGIEFQPVELSTYEWLQDGKREKIYGKL